MFFAPRVAKTRENTTDLTIFGHYGTEQKRCRGNTNNNNNNNSNNNNNNTNTNNTNTNNTTNNTSTTNKPNHTNNTNNTNNTRNTTTTNNTNNTNTNNTNNTNTTSTTNTTNTTTTTNPNHIAEAFQSLLPDSPSYFWKENGRVAFTRLHFMYFSLPSPLHFFFGSFLAYLPFVFPLSSSFSKIGLKFPGKLKCFFDDDL